jgi:hypothetical protein
MSDAAAAEAAAAAAAAKAKETLRDYALRREEQAQAQALLATSAEIATEAEAAAEPILAPAEIAVPQKKRSKKALKAAKAEQEEEILDLLLLLCREEVVMPLASCCIQWMPLQAFIIEHYVVLREARHRQFCSKAEWKSAGWKGGEQLKAQWRKKQLVLAALLKEVQDGGNVRRLPVSLPRASKALSDAFGTGIQRYSTGSDCMKGVVFLLNSGVQINQWPASTTNVPEDLFDRAPKRESWLEVRAIHFPPGSASGRAGVPPSSHGYLKFPKAPEVVLAGGRPLDSNSKSHKTTQYTAGVPPRVALFTKKKVPCALNTGLVYTGDCVSDKALEKKRKDNSDRYNFTVSNRSVFVDPGRRFESANNPGVTMYALADGKAVVSSALTTYPDYHGIKESALCCGNKKDQKNGKLINLYTIDEGGRIIEVDALDLEVFYVSTVVGFEVDASKKNSLKVVEERKKGEGKTRWHHVTIIGEAPTAAVGEVPDLGPESGMAIFANDRSVNVWATMNVGGQPNKTILNSSGDEVSVAKIDVTKKDDGQDAHNYLSMNVLGVHFTNLGRPFRVTLPAVGFDLRESSHNPGAIPKDTELGVGYGDPFWEYYKKTLRNVRGEAIQIPKKKYTKAKKNKRAAEQNDLQNLLDDQDPQQEKMAKRAKTQAQTKKAQDRTTVRLAQQVIGDHRIKITTKLVTAKLVQDEELVQEGEPQTARVQEVELVQEEETQETQETRKKNSGLVASYQKQQKEQKV